MKYLWIVSLIGTMASLFNLWVNMSMIDRINYSQSVCVAGQYYYK